MFRSTRPAVLLLLILVFAAFVGGCAHRGERAGGGDAFEPPTSDRMIPEPKDTPKAQEVLPDYVPQKSWEYASMPEPAPEGRPSMKIDDVSFDQGSSALTREGFAVCRTVAEWMRKNSSLDVLIIGQASQFEQNSDALGRKRAEAAKNYLVRDLGVPNGRLHVASFGSRFSKADQSEPGLQKVERRVEFWSMK